MLSRSSKGKRIRNHVKGMAMKFNELKAVKEVDCIPVKINYEEEKEGVAYFKLSKSRRYYLKRGTYLELTKGVDADIYPGELVWFTDIKKIGIMWDGVFYIIPASILNEGGE